MIVAATLVAAISAFVCRPSARRPRPPGAAPENNDPVFKVSFQRRSAVIRPRSRTSPARNPPLHLHGEHRAEPIPPPAPPSNTPIAVHSGSFSRTNSFNSGKHQGPATRSAASSRARPRQPGRTRRGAPLIADPTKTLRQPQGALDDSQAVAGRPAKRLTSSGEGATAPLPRRLSGPWRDDRRREGRNRRRGHARPRKLII